MHIRIADCGLCKSPCGVKVIIFPDEGPTQYAYPVGYPNTPANGLYELTIEVSLEPHEDWGIINAPDGSFATYHYGITQAGVRIRPCRAVLSRLHPLFATLTHGNLYYHATYTRIAD